MKFELTPEEVNIIGVALGQMPFNQVVNLINKLQQQIKDQESKAEPVDVPEGE